MLNLSAAIFELVSSGLLVDEFLHWIVAIPFGIYLWYKTKNWRLLRIFFAVVWLIDFDHLIDYWLYFGLKLDLLEFVKLDFFNEKASVILIFHAWEWVAIYFLVFFRKHKWDYWATAVIWGVLAHLVWDIHNFGSVEFYSLTYRAWKGWWGF